MEATPKGRMAEGEKCARCGLDIHRGDPKRHGTYGPVHLPERCVELLKMHLSKAQAELKRLRSDCRAVDLEWSDANADQTTVSGET